MLIGLYVIKRARTFMVNRLQVTILKTCEVELLIREEVQGSCEYSERHRFQVFRALGHYHYVGSCLALLRFTQTTCWQQLIVDDKAMIIYQKDIYTWFNITMLIGIIKEDDISILGCFIGSDAVYALHLFLSTAILTSLNFLCIW